MGPCTVILNTGGNKKTLRYKVYCTTATGDRKFIGWVANWGAADGLRTIIEILGGTDVKFIDTEKKV